VLKVQKTLHLPSSTRRETHKKRTIRFFIHVSFFSADALNGTAVYVHQHDAVAWSDGDRNYVVIDIL
jgi:hypothetical protein